MAKLNEETYKLILEDVAVGHVIMIWVLCNAHAIMMIAVSRAIHLTIATRTAGTAFPASFSQMIFFLLYNHFA